MKRQREPSGKKVDPLFCVFWQSYPRRAAKVAALVEWNKLAPDVSLFERIMRALEIHKCQDQWTRDGGMFIPFPVTWLRQRRWEDETDSSLSQSPPAPQRLSRKPEVAERERSAVCLTNAPTAKSDPDTSGAKSSD